ncbi:hypothetical protein B566_EDAN012049 [Ephemera danica]|nr:hypothetical protein B566_EDAN012049 [Ephemera danica]
MPDQTEVVKKADSLAVMHKRKRNRKKSKAGKNVDESVLEVESSNYASVERKLPSQNWETFLKSQKPKAGRRKPLQSHSITAEITDVVALDCEMVGAGEKGKDNMLARVSVVNQLGQVLYDSFVKPLNDVEITDYRTKYSGVRPGNLKNGTAEFRDAQRTVSNLIDGRIVVGHDLKNDFKVLYLGHPRKKIRDTSKYKAFQELATGHGKAKPSLKVLSDKILDMKIQHGEHDSVMDAKAAMALYNLHQREWEASFNKNRTKKKKDSSTSVPKRGSSRALLAEAMAGELSAPPVSKKPQITSTKSNVEQSKPKEKSTEIPINTNPRIGEKRKRTPSKVRKNAKKPRAI